MVNMDPTFIPDSAPCYYHPSFASLRIRESLKADVCVYGGTSGGVIAALKSAVEAGDIGGEFLQNPYTGQPIKVECSPGNIALRTVGNKTFFCAYNENGIELRARLTFEATTQATTQPGR